MLSGKALSSVPELNRALTHTGPRDGGAPRSRRPWLRGVLLFVGYGTGKRDASTLEPQRALADPITMLSRRSQALERELAELPSMHPEDPATLRVLAGRIASVDDRLSATHVAPTPATEALWRTRVDLMESYTRLRREEADALLLRVVY